MAHEFDFYPRLTTIPVPAALPENEIGDYVSHHVSKILMGLGVAALNRKSIVLKALTPRLFLFQYETSKPYTQTLYDGRLESSDPVSPKARPDKVAKGNQDGPGKVNPTRGA